MADATESGLTLEELRQETEVLDGLGRKWRVGPYSIWDSEAGVRLTVYQLYAILSPLRRVPPPAPVVWRARGDFEMLRVCLGEVQFYNNARGQWEDYSDSQMSRFRLITALAEGRDPSSLAERVEVAS